MIHISSPKSLKKHFLNFSYFFLEHIQDVHKFKLNSTLESTERLMLQQEQAGIFFENVLLRF